MKNRYSSTLEHAQIVKLGKNLFRAQIIESRLGLIEDKKRNSVKDKLVGTSNAIKAWLLRYGVPSEEVKIALDQMKLRNENLAEFGIQGRFMFTKRSTPVIEKKEGNLIKVNFGGFQNDN